MTVMIPLIPDNAPFSPAQRAWLNGFFAGLMGPDQQAAALTLPGGAPAPEAAEDFPWHDSSLSLAERMALADGKPAARRMMAAMAQLDCGQCGYQCQTYAEAIASGAEKSLNRCQPGGKETARKLKELLGEIGAGAPVAAAPASAPKRPETREAIFLAARPLNAPASEKDTRHVVLKLDEATQYEAGDSLGVAATNCPELAAAVIEALGAAPEAPVLLADGRSLRLQTALIQACDIGRPSDPAVLCLMEAAKDAGEAALLRKLAEGEEVDGFEAFDLLDLLQAFPSARPDPAQLAVALDLLQPRLYSIASSPKAHPGEVHLTVGVVRESRRGRARKGVASTHLAERVAPGAPLPVYVQKSHGFRLPADGGVPVIMVGPGTGIAPFRAFLQERRATGASGRNWLFFGNPRAATDFLYREELEGWHGDGFLTRFDTAFSRDQAQKVYVQDRMREQAAELWTWLDAGAHLYVCGDAKRMARDVDQALQDVAVKQGGLDAAAAKAWTARLAKDGRYQRDVY